MLILSLVFTFAYFLIEGKSKMDPSVRWDDECGLTNAVMSGLAHDPAMALPKSRANVPSVLTFG